MVLLLWNFGLASNTYSLFFSLQERSRTSARGTAACGGSHGRTSWRATTANTRARNPSSVSCVSGPSRDQTTYRCTWSGTEGAAPRAGNLPVRGCLDHWVLALPLGGAEGRRTRAKGASMKRVSLASRDEHWGRRLQLESGLVSPRRRCGPEPSAGWPLFPTTAERGDGLTGRSWCRWIPVQFVST